MIVWHPFWLVKQRSTGLDVFSLDPAGCGGYGHLAFVISGLNQRPPAKRVAGLMGHCPKRLKQTIAL